MTAGPVLDAKPVPSFRAITPPSAAVLAVGLACVGCAGEREVSGQGHPASGAGIAQMLAAFERRAEAPQPDAAILDASTLGPELGSFRLTYYWMASESASADSQEVQLFTKRCKPLAKVSRAFANRLELEGTGRLSDGRTLNISGLCRCPYSPCFVEVAGRKRWGMGVGKRPLSPFRSVAVDPEMIPIGVTLYIPELDGLTMPGREPWGGFVHDGCVSADDTGGKVNGNQLDFYTANPAYYRALDKRHRLKHVTVFDGRGRCERKNDEIVRVNRNSI